MGLAALSSMTEPYLAVEKFIQKTPSVEYMAELPKVYFCSCGKVWKNTRSFFLIAI